MKYYFRSHGRSPKTRFEGGWKAFAEDNNLKLGDVCAFVLRKSTGIMLFEVVIFCENGVANSPMVPGKHELYLFYNNIIVVLISFPK